MDKNTPLSSLPSSEHEMEKKDKDISKKKTTEVDPTEPSLNVIKNIQNYSKALNVKSTKTVLQQIEYISN